MKRKNINVLFCGLYCLLIGLHTVLAVLTSHTRLTLEAAEMLEPFIRWGGQIRDILFWVLALAEIVKNWKRGLLCLEICFLLYFFDIGGGNRFLLQIILLAGLSNLSSKKITGYAWLATHALYFAVLLIFLQNGMVTDRLMPNDKTFLPVTDGHSLGMGHANNLGGLLATSAMMLYLILKPKRWWVKILYFELSAVIVLWITVSRTAAVILAIFPLIEALCTGFLKKKSLSQKGSLIFGFGVPLGILAANIVISLVALYYLPWEITRHSFWLRFKDIVAIIENGLTLWGGSYPGYYFDSLYYWIITNCGLIPSLGILVLYAFTIASFAKKKNILMVTSTIIFLLYGLMENLLIHPFYGFLPLIAFAPNALEELRTARDTEEAKEHSFRYRLAAFSLCFIVAFTAFYGAVRDDWKRTAISTEPISASGLISKSHDQNLTIAQTFTPEVDRLMSVQLMPGKIQDDAHGTIRMQILDESSVLWEGEVESDSLNHDILNNLPIDPAIEGVRGKPLKLVIDTGKTGISFYRGTKVSAGRFEAELQTDKKLTANGDEMEGGLVLGTHGENDLNADRWIAPVWALIYLVCLTLMLMVEKQKRTGKVNPVGRIHSLIHQYSYLLKTLVIRDFKIKYQSSVLGMLWSFLNPLLMMMVYYFVFSMIFKSNIANFPVYLLSGIVLFNYFSESTSLGLLSIVGNRTLITKVYMPKYIYPLAKVLSSAINLGTSLIPLFIVIFLTGLPLHKSIVLLPLVVMFEVMFCLGLSLILSTLNVFFRDIQFLWGILITIWNFLTPIFYPESIIPPAFITLYHLNPLYQIVYFMRCIVIGGISPAPITYLYCLLVCGVPLILGVLFFKKNQDRFVLHL